MDQQFDTINKKFVHRKEWNVSVKEILNLIEEIRVQTNDVEIQLRLLSDAVTFLEEWPIENGHEYVNSINKFNDILKLKLTQTQQIRLNALSLRACEVIGEVVLEKVITKFGSSLSL